jgi:hypothetical protein
MPPMSREVSKPPLTEALRKAMTPEQLRQRQDLSRRSGDHAANNLKRAIAAKKAPKAPHQ